MARAKVELMKVLYYTRRPFFDNISFAADKVSDWLLTGKRTINENSVAGPPLITPTKPNKIKAFKSTAFFRPFLALPPS